MRRSGPAWQAAGATVITTAAGLVLKRPLDDGRDAVLLGALLATVCGSLLCVAMMRWASRKYLPFWFAVTLVSTAAVTFVLYSYDAQWKKRVGTYQGRQEVVGEEYTPAGAIWIKSKPSDADPDSLLFAFGGRAQEIWTSESIVRVKNRMWLLYVSSLPLIASAILAAFQTIQCVRSTTRRRLASHNPDDDALQKSQPLPASMHVVTVNETTTARSKTTRILFLAANPLTTSRLDLEEELRGVEAELRGVRFRENIALVTGHAVRPDDLVRLLREEEPTVVHFSGHGEPQGIVLRTSAGHVPVPGATLARLFRDRGIALVVLNACHSASQAVQLVDSVSAVVGTTHAVEDEAACRFSAAFYRTLGNGHSVKDAYRDAGDAVAGYALTDVFGAYGNLEQTLCGPRT